MTDRFAHASSFGATPTREGKTLFRFWAPDREQAWVDTDGEEPRPMTREPGGWFSLTTDCPAGTRYRYRLDPTLSVPDPAARAQHDDAHGWSVVVDPGAYTWQHSDWQGRPWHETILYELHAGTMGGFRGVMERLPALAELGVTAVELMPVADFPGRHNWGYDGVLHYAPDEAYGSPEDLKALVDAAHGLGLMIFLDVVYNHFGPDGNYLNAYAKGFFRHDLPTPWGDAIDFRRAEVRDFFTENALYWLQEYRFDGLRFDAVHAITSPDFLDEMAARVRETVAPGRHVHLVLEHDENAAHHLRGGPGQPGFDAQWNDDFHHCLHVLLTGETKHYYDDYAEQPAAMLARCLAEGYAYQGEPSLHRDGRPRGEPSGHLPPTAFVNFLQNHDQIGNRALGERLIALSDPDALRAATAMLLAAPAIPLLFMGEEWGSDSPFLYFTDHSEELATAVREGRKKEFKALAEANGTAGPEDPPDPNDPATFAASVANPTAAEPADQNPWLALHRTLLALRRDEIIPRLPGARSLGAAAAGAAAVRAQWRLGDGTVLTIAANLGADPATTEASRGRTLFETAPGIAEAARAGTLEPRSAAVLLRGGMA